MSENAHAFCPPSGADIWGKCPLFAKMNELNPHGLQGDTDSTIEGSAAHEAFAAAVAGTPMPKIASNGVMVDREMIECALAAADAVRAVSDCSGLASEKRLPPIEYFGPDVWGTPDLTQYDPEAMCLRVWDYKYGHRYVPAILNEQLATYCALVLGSIGLFDGPAEVLDAVRCECRILQPRSFGRAMERLWIVTGKELRPIWANLRARAAESRLTNPPSVAGDHCRYCPGRLDCRANEIATGAACDFAETTGIAPTTPDELSARLSAVLRAKALLDSQHKALEAYALQVATRGERLPGFHIERTSGKEVWKEPARAIAFGKLLGLDFADVTACSPAQARKRGASADVVKNLTRRTSGSEKVVEDDDQFLNFIFNSKGN